MSKKHESYAIGRGGMTAEHLKELKKGSIPGSYNQEYMGLKPKEESLEPERKK